MNRRYKPGVDRNQAMLLPPSVEEYVSPDNPVRAIEAYVQSLDMAALGFRNAAPGVSAGQPAYAPQALLKLYLYGYLMRVRSSRLLARETTRNLEVIWLVERLTPCYKTIADFRKDNAKALTAANRDFVLLCKELDLYGAELVAIDGSFFRGNVAKGSIYTLPRLKKLIGRIDKDIAAYHQALNQADSADASLTPAAPLAEKLHALKQRQAHYQDKLKQLHETDETQYAEVDPDARLLKKSGETVAGYNVQIVTDSKHKLVVSAALTSDGNDTEQLAPMAIEAKTLLGVERLEACADAGYYNQVGLKQCLEAGITPYVPIPDHHGSHDPDKRLSREAFTFEAQTNDYRCPAGERLRFRRVVEEGGKRLFNYVSDQRVCANCSLKTRCLSAKTPYREIYRWEHEAIVDAHRRRMQERSTDYLKQRDGLVEHPFGTLKRWCGWTHFLVRRQQKVCGEMNLLMLCYNFKRVMTILGMDRFLEHLKERAKRILPKAMDIPTPSIA